MIPVLSREQVRAVDGVAIDEFHIPGIALMENAGRGAAEVIAEEVEIEDALVVVVCGPGNNGGDGFVVARRLSMFGADVLAILIGEASKLKGDARSNHEAWVGIGGDFAEIGAEDDLSVLGEALSAADVVVDALFGTGLDRVIEGRMRDVITALNRAGGVCFALDVPSGIDANTGAVLGVAVEAHQTITFAERKLGLFTPSGARHAGELSVVDIGAPAATGERAGLSAYLLETEDVAQVIRPRSVAAHKGTNGRVLAISGSPGTIGASLLLARGALRSGAGLVWIAALPDAIDAVEARVLEEMTARIDPAAIAPSLDAMLEGKDAVVIGPGLGHSKTAREIVDHVVLSWDGTKVVDADAITHLAGRASELEKAPGTLVLTPHPGEMGRLLDVPTAQVEADRFAAVQRASEEARAVVVLKGAHTLIASPGVPPVINSSGNAALATAGSGDVLSGILGAFSCLLPARTAAFSAVHVHGLAGDRWRARTGSDRGLLAREIADEVPGVLAALAAGSGVLPD